MSELPQRKSPAASLAVALSVCIATLIFGITLNAGVKTPFGMGMMSSLLALGAAAIGFGLARLFDNPRDTIGWILAVIVVGLWLTISQSTNSAMNEVFHMLDYYVRQFIECREGRAGSVK